MAHAGKKLGPGGTQGKGDGSGAMSTRPQDLPDNKVLSNRDKSQHNRERGQDGKWIESEQRFATQDNQRPER
jgi:hypothetical protein